MEVGRRSAGSNNDLRETRGKKKPWSLPLATLLSFNDKDVHPECPNASNVYHKCGRHCLDRIPSGKLFTDALTSDEDRGKQPEKRGIIPNCPNTSNPFHKCAEYCFEILPEKQQGAGKNQPAMEPKGEEKPGFTTERLVKPECKNASNLHHVCDEYCLRNAPARDQPRQVLRLKSSREVKKVHINKERMGSPPLCKYSSNSYHECTALCFQSVPDSNLLEGDNSKGVPTKPDKSIVRPSPEHASSAFLNVDEYCFEDTPEMDHHKGDSETKKESEMAGTVIQGVSEEKRLGQEDQGGVPTTTAKTNIHHNNKNMTSPLHEITERCFDDTFEKEQPEGVVKPKEGSEIVLVEEDHVVKLECKNASNPSHLCAENCSQSLPKSEHHGQVFRIKSLKEGKKMPGKRDMKLNDEDIEFTAQPGVDSEGKNVSDPSHARAKDCFQNVPVKNQHVEAVTKMKEDNEVVIPLESGMNSQCKNASNPHHVRADYCLQDVPKEHHLGRALSKSKEEKIVVSPSQKVKLKCTKASNPYHVCAEYCFEDVIERDQPVKAIMKPKEEEGTLLPPEVVPNPDCKFASNPYHACTEYCFQDAPQKEHRIQILKLKSLKELKNLVSNKKITTGHPQCSFASNSYHDCTEYCITKNKSSSNIPEGAMKTNVKKKENNHSMRRDVNPNSKHAPNPFHRCPEPKNEEVEGIKERFQEEKRNSFEETTHHHTEKKSSMRSDSRKRILQEPTNNNFDLTEKTKDLSQSVSEVIEMKNPDEPKDMQTSKLIEVPDLFHEWAKYCSQEKVADDDDMVVQKNIGFGGLSSRNGEGSVFLNDHESTKAEKRRTRGVCA